MEKASININEYGFDRETYNYEEENNKLELIPARIIETQRDRFKVVCNNGITIATLKRGQYYDNDNMIYPTIGDFVLIEWNDLGESKIIKTFERKSYFSRLDPYPGMKKEQVIAANFDYVFIMQSLNNNYNIRRLERYLTLAWESHAIPVILLTKSDLVEDYSMLLYEVECIALGVDVIAISTKTNDGIEKLNQYLKPGITSVFLGSSGVGKSTLVNKLAGKEVMKIGDIREEDSKGRHTTTNRELILLPNKSMIIDTPGMRELGLLDSSEGVDKTFQDVEEYIGKCKYSNCTHTCEDGCAILEAIKLEKLSEDRVNSYIKLKKESEYIENSDTYLKEKKKKFKEIAKQNRNNIK